MSSPQAAEQLEELLVLVHFAHRCVGGLAEMIAAARPGSMLPADKLGALLEPVADHLRQAGMLCELLVAPPA